ncbi:sulfatase-like hydrolase/transferase [Rhizobium sp. CRIBSB]|nr:sulfatase-like hydrolase/transferase [Rhizobium sp. CRIBSB]
MRRSLLAGIFSVVALTFASSASAQATTGGNGGTPQPGNWPITPRAAPDAPSILLIMTDDVGFGASSTFGGPVETPTFDALARDGLRYNAVTTTGICSPSRAALLTGRNHNTVNVGNVVDAPSGTDGYTSVIPDSAATGARVLADAGYSTAMFGKAHITPMWELGPTGPFDRWPTGLGFQHFYGFMMGDTNQFVPSLYNGTTPVEPPQNDPDYILDRDLADNAINWIQTQRGTTPNKPFFIYYAPGTAHAPLQAPPDWIARYRGRFDAGWDALRDQTLTRQKALGIVPADTVLATRPADIPAWANLTAEQKRVYAREMEVYAASLSFADHQMGRVVDAAREASGGNLLVIYIQGDNGGSGEGGVDGTVNEHALVSGFRDDFATIAAAVDEMGGPDTLTGYSAGWAFASNTPFPWVKQVASHFGATRNGVVINWPGHIAAPGGVRTQFHHIIDIMPTILEAAEVPLPETVDGVVQKPFDGVSMVYSLNAPQVPSTRSTQYYLIWDSMGLYHDGWMASSSPILVPWRLYPDLMMPAQVEGRQWELYNINEDFSQSTNVAAQYPEKLEELKTLFFAEAGRHNGLPVRRFVTAPGRPDPNAGVSTFRFFGPASRIQPDAAPPMVGRSFDIEATVEVPAGGGNGTILALGGRFGGLTLYLKDGQASFEYNFFDHERTTVTAPIVLAPGKRTIRVSLDQQGGFLTPATVLVSVDGQASEAVQIPRTAPARLTLDESFDIGSDTGTAVSQAYAAPHRLDGTIESVAITIRPPTPPAPRQTASQ